MLLLLFTVATMFKIFFCAAIQFCFIAQFAQSVVRADYLILRKGFIMVLVLSFTCSGIWWLLLEHAVDTFS
jgi:hypothetical protein